MSRQRELARGEVGEAHGNPRSGEPRSAIKDTAHPRWNELMEEVPSVPTSLETVAPRYLCTDGRRMVPDTCPSQPKFLVERSPLLRASASGMSRG
jgi:hypothetical protein